MARFVTAFLPLLALVLLGFAGHATPREERRPSAAVAPSELVSAQRGTLPLLLSVPHGGGVRVPGSRDRTTGVLLRDVATDRLAFLVVQRLTEKLGAKPYFVIAQFSRKDADANRKPSKAYENEAARLHYDAYHRVLAEFVAEIHDTHAHGLMIDLHGQSAAPGTTFRGTRNGRTVKALLERHGRAALDGPESLFGRLAAAGFVVHPARPGAKESRDFGGGFLVGTYGSHEPGGIDAIQVEVGRDRRTRKTLLKTADDLAAAVAGFWRKYYGAE